MRSGNSRLDAVARRPKAFIVHGHDEAALREVCDILARRLRLAPIVLGQEPGMGRTVIESLEFHATRSDIAIVLLSGDDRIVGGAGEHTVRGRQNVIFELGYFCAALGRDRVCILYQEGVELPSDVAGVLYYSYKSSPIEALPKLSRHLEELGLGADTAGNDVVLVVDDDLRPDSPLYRQIRRALQAKAETELENDPEKACLTLSRNRRCVGCITDIVFRSSSELAGVQVANVATSRGLPTLIITSHSREHLGIALTELKRLGVRSSDILTKPATPRQYAPFLKRLAEWPVW